MPLPLPAAGRPGPPPAAPLPWIMACLSLVVLLASLATSIANVGLPTFMRVFDAPFNAIQWVVLSYLLAVTTFVVSAGRLADILGRRHLMLAGIAVFTLASIACAAARELWVLVAARAAQGLGAAVMMALAMAVITDAVPRERVGRAMGLLGTMSAIGTALGPPLGGALVASLGWQSIFLVNLPPGLVALGLAYRHLPARRGAADRPSFDFAGSALLAVTLGAYALTMTLGRSSPAAARAAWACAALCGLVLFLYAESRIRAPLLRPALLRQPVVGSGLAMSSLVTTVVMATLVVGPFYLGGVLHLDTAATGLVMSAGPLVAALAGMPAGRAVDRFGAARTTAWGLAFMGAGCLALSLLPPAFGIWGYIGPLVTLTAGFAGFQAANNTAVLQGVEAGQRGVVSGLLNLSRNLGLISGASAMGAVFTSTAGSVDLVSAAPDAIAAGTRATFAAGAGCIAVALGLAMRASRRFRQATPLAATGTAR